MKLKNLSFLNVPSLVPAGILFSDIERLMDIAEKIEDGVLTREIRDDLYKRRKKILIQETKRL